MTTLTLRPYQQDAVTACGAAWALGQRRILVHWATGAGKTSLFTSIIMDRLDQGQRCLVIAHRGELLDQAQARLHMFRPLARSGRVQAGRNETSADVVYASVQTIADSRRLEQLGAFGLVVVDEVHHASSRTYRTVMGELGCWADDGPDTLGVTATIDRADGKNLGAIFEKIVHTYGIDQAIADGYLCVPRGRQVATDLDMSRVRVTAGDYNTGDLADEMHRVDIAGAIVRAWRDWAADRHHTVVFVPLVSIAEDVARAFDAAGIPAGMVHGGMKSKDREVARRDFEQGRTKIVAQAMLWTEGVDIPAIDAVIWARPTQSRALYQQGVGRALRLYPGKADALVLDLVGATSDHPLVGISALYPPAATEIAVEFLRTMLGPGPRRRSEVMRLAEAQGLTRESLNLGAHELRIVTREIDGERWVSIPTGAGGPGGGMGADDEPGLGLLDRKMIGGDAASVDMLTRSRFVWQQVGDTWTLPGGLRLVPDASRAGSWCVLLRSKLLGEGLDLTTAMAAAEEHVRGSGAMQLADRQAPWRDEPPTTSQLAWLRKAKVRQRPQTKGEAADLMNATIERWRQKKPTTKGTK